MKSKIILNYKVEKYKKFLKLFFKEKLSLNSERHTFGDILKQDSSQNTVLVELLLRNIFSSILFLNIKSV